MAESILEISLSDYTPRTFGADDLQKKRDLRDRIKDKVENIESIREKTRGKRLELKIDFKLYSETTEMGRKTKDLDNLLKIFCDTLPDYIDRGKTTEGLGIIEGDRDDMIFKIISEKKLVPDENSEGIDFVISEYQE